MAMIRLALAVAFAGGLLSSGPASAADMWIEYVNREDRFVVNLPGIPRVEEFVYMSEFMSPWPARRYVSESDGYTYRMTVVDMSTTSIVPGTETFRNIGRPGIERRGAIAHAAMQLRQTGKVTIDAYEELQSIPGHKLEIELPNGGVNLAVIHIHDKLLYILECLSPPGRTPAYDVHSSIAILNREGVPMRYLDEDYSFPDRMPLGRSFAADGVSPAGSYGPTTTAENARPAFTE